MSIVSEADAVGKHDFSQFRAMTRPWIVELNNVAGDLDITSWTFLMAVYTEPRPTTPPTPLFTIAGVIVQAVATSLADPATVRFTPLTANTDRAPGAYFHDVKATDTVPNPDIVLKGEIVILQGINPIAP